MTVAEEREPAAPMAPMAVTAMLVDDQELVLEGLARVLSQRGMEVAGQFTDGASAMGFLAENAVDLAIVDTRVQPGGAEAVAKLRKMMPAGRVVVLSDHADPWAAMAALENGATGFLLKSTSTAELGSQLTDAATGKLVIDSAVAAAVLTAPQSISTNELVALRHVANGLTNREIGKLMCLSHYTVKEHLGKIMRKLGTRTRAEAVAKAVQHGMLPCSHRPSTHP